VIGLVVASHWVLDLIVHRADLPILPGNAGDLPRLGLGVWRYPLVSFSMELALVLVGAWLYWRTASRVAKTEGSGARAAGLAAALIAVFGVLVLWLDFTGI
jgi:short subunit fatty acids transporter